MQNNLTELVFILDKSGSMSGLESDTIGGFNSMITKQKKEKGEALISTVLFSDRSVVIHDRENIKEVKKMTSKDYSVGGCTALLDAIGDAIHHISNIHKYIRKEDIPAHTLFVITTDGWENASHKYSYSDIKKMINKQEEKGWEFMFLGANIDTLETAEDLGIKREMAVNYNNDSIGTALNYETLSDSICELRSVGSISKDWNKKINKDFKQRKK